MSHNITVEGGTSVRLPTAGKYCDRDIVVTATGGGAVAEPVIEPLTITENGTYTAPNGVDGYSPVTVNVPIPDGYIQPSGTLDVTENGTHDVTAYASVNVNVPTGGGGVVEPDPRDQYQRVEYIESAEEGTYPYIITDFYADNDSGVEVIASFPTIVDAVPMGSRQDSGGTRFYCSYQLADKRSYYGFGTGHTVDLNKSVPINTIMRMHTNFLNSRLSGVCLVDGTRRASASISGTIEPHTIPVSIFGYNHGETGVVTAKREFKLYSARCSKGHEVIREYIPCYRKGDGVVGLYEKFTKQFLTSEDGGTFAKGAEIDW